MNPRKSCFLWNHSKIDDFSCVSNVYRNNHAHLWFIWCMSHVSATFQTQCATEKQDTNSCNNECERILFFWSQSATLYLIFCFVLRFPFFSCTRKMNISCATMWLRLSLISPAVDVSTIQSMQTLQFEWDVDEGEALNRNANTFGRLAVISKSK